MMRDARHSSEMEMATMINRGGVAGVVPWWWWLFEAFFGSLGLKCTISRGAESKIHHNTARKRRRSHFVCSSQSFGPLYAGLVAGMRVVGLIPKRPQAHVQTTGNKQRA